MIPINGLPELRVIFQKRLNAFLVRFIDGLGHRISGFKIFVPQCQKFFSACVREVVEMPHKLLSGYYLPRPVQVQRSVDQHLPPLDSDPYQALVTTKGRSVRMGVPQRSLRRAKNFRMPKVASDNSPRTVHSLTPPHRWPKHLKQHQDRHQATLVANNHQLKVGVWNWLYAGKIKCHPGIYIYISYIAWQSAVVGIWIENCNIGYKLLPNRSSFRSILASQCLWSEDIRRITKHM